MGDLHPLPNQSHQEQVDQQFDKGIRLLNRKVKSALIVFNLVCFNVDSELVILYSETKSLVKTENKGFNHEAVFLPSLLPMVLCHASITLCHFAPKCHRLFDMYVNYKWIHDCIHWKTSSPGLSSGIIMKCYCQNILNS